MVSSGLTTKGITFCIGASQAAKEAAAVLKPKNFRKSRREVEDSDNFSSSPKKASVGNCSANSSFWNFSNSGLFTNSPKPWKYVFFVAILIISFSKLVVTFTTLQTTDHIYSNFFTVIFLNPIFI